MSLTPENRERLLQATREAAAAFIEDMTHIREVMKRYETDRQQLRNLSGILRRLLIDKGGDLKDIAAPRIGRLTILCPDNDPIFEAIGEASVPFFHSGGAIAFGIQFRAILLKVNNEPRIPSIDPAKMIARPIDNFMSQNVLCLRGQWARRLDTIKYMANVASGVHSGASKEDVERLLSRIRHAAKWSLVPLPANYASQPGQLGPSLMFDIQTLNDSTLPFSYDAKNIDPVLLEVLATAHCLAISPDIIKLEAVVNQELSA